MTKDKNKKTDYLQKLDDNSIGPKSVGAFYQYAPNPNSLKEPSNLKQLLGTRHTTKELQRTQEMDQCESQVYCYYVDINNIIVSVGKDWKSFAEENLADNTCLPENLIGTSLFDHIHDSETKHLYGLILQKVREYGSKATFSFRCDSPEKRRFLKLAVTPMKDDAIEFKSQIIRTGPRESVELMRSDIPRSEEFLRICSMCKKIAVSDNEWEEVEIAIEIMKLFNLEVLPQFTHGLCQTCFNAAMAELDSLEKCPA